MKKHLDKIFLVLGFIGTMLCTSYTVYSNVNKFNSSWNKLQDKKEEPEPDYDEAEDMEDIDET